MSITLRPAIEKQLRASAARHGTPVEEYLELLIMDAAAEDEPLPATPADAVKYWERTGVFDHAPAGPDSPELARQWRERDESIRGKTG